MLDNLDFMEPERAEETFETLQSLQEDLNMLTSWLVEGQAHPEASFAPVAAEAVNYTRKNLQDFSAADIRNLLRAFRELNRSSNRVWGRFVFLHNLFASIAHGSVRFLPWHRAMVWAMEQAIRNTSAGRSLAIPYWTWWQPAGSARKGIPSRLAAFTPTIRMPSPADLSDSGFRRLLARVQEPSVRRAMGWRSLTDTQAAVASALSQRTIPVARSPRRNLVSGGTIAILRPGRIGQGLDLPSRSAIRTVLNETDFASFSRRLEGIHGTPHLWVGWGAPGGRGALGNVAISPADCLFFFHHAEVDRLFHLWQSRHGTPFSGATTGADMPPWRFSFADVWDVSGSALNFSYANRSTDQP